VRSCSLAFFDHGDRNFPERFEQLGVLLEYLHDLDGGREAGGSAADDRDANFNPLVLRVRGDRDELVHLINRRREL